jgi:hypothetical protein
MIATLQPEGKSEYKDLNLMKPIRNIAESARKAMPMGIIETKVRNNNIPTIDMRTTLVRSKFLTSLEIFWRS